MNVMKSVTVGCLCLAIAASVMAQSNDSKKKAPPKQKSEKATDVVRYQKRVPQVSNRVPTLSNQRPTTKPRRPEKGDHWKNNPPYPTLNNYDKWWKQDHENMKRKLKLSSSQGSRISQINRSAAMRIHAAQKSGLRGEALSRRIRQIRADARRQIDRELSADQRRRWDGDSWESRWDDRSRRG